MGGRPRGDARRRPLSVLVDSSAWIAYLRGSGTPVAGWLTQAIVDDRPLATTDVVVMEVLAGARDPANAAQLRSLLARCQLHPVGGLESYEEAAAIYRRARTQGVTVRALTDCLIAAVAIRDDLPVLHQDRDFGGLDRVTALRIATL